MRLRFAQVSPPEYWLNQFGPVPLRVQQAPGEIRDQKLSHRLLTGLSPDETIARMAISNGTKDAANSACTSPMR
jgi:hypothetical protein